MTTALHTDTTLTTDQVKRLRSNDVENMMGISCTIEDSGQHLDRYYHNNSRRISDHTPPVYGGFWTKVGEVAAILKDSTDWPFPPLMVREGVLYDGHHRANAAIKAGWDKEIPVTTEMTWW
ncbi:ParB-like nuclease domain protein [Mycobacterium phage BogosyJay]|nr:ParB-like nuclease domain protein [Mycobacterium phage Maminiaina]QFG14992.1 ParB-like nuclease domain protein [Mycobacterium phage BogosyJay]